MITTRQSFLAAMMFAVIGLSRADFDRLPLATASRAPRSYERDMGRNRYTGAMLRQIRASGQGRECARRLQRLSAVVA